MSCQLNNNYTKLLLYWCFAFIVIMSLFIKYYQICLRLCVHDQSYVSELSGILETECLLFRLSGRIIKKSLLFSAIWCRRKCSIISPVSCGVKFFPDQLWDCKRVYAIDVEILLILRYIIKKSKRM